MSRRAQILSHRKRERERLGMHAVGGTGADWQKERKKERERERVRKKDGVRKREG